MAGPPEGQRATGSRGTNNPGTKSVPAKAGATQKVVGGKPVPAKPFIGSSAPVIPVSARCYEFITINPEKSNPLKGTGVHRVIKEQLGRYITLQGYGPPISIQLIDGSFDHYRDKRSVRIGGDGIGNGNVDLAFRSRGGTVMLLAEIKPANDKFEQGEVQLLNYLNKANENEELKQKFGVQVFSPMPPNEAFLMPVVYQGTWFETRWCGPGIILYKEIPDEENKKKEKSKNKEKVKEKAKAKDKNQDKAKDKPRKIEILRSAPRNLQLEAWTPEPLRRAILTGTLEDGLYRDRFTASWPSGYTTNVVVWVKTGPFGKEYQYYQEFPSDPAFYRGFASRRGLSEWQGDLIRKTMVEYNNDLWSLLAPDPESGQPSSRNPEYARGELRAIYSGVLRGMVQASAIIVGAGAGITSTSNAMSPRGTAGKSIRPDSRKVQSKEAPLPDSRKIQAKEAPLPDWMNRAVQKGADTFEEFEKAMRVMQ